MDELEKQDENQFADREDVYSKPVRAGKRTYFFDVKATRRDEYYLTITESKRKTAIDGKYFFEKHKIFLYKEDFEKFSDGLKDAVNFILEHKPIEQTTDDNTKEVKSPDISFEDIGKKQD